MTKPGRPREMDDTKKITCHIPGAVRDELDSEAEEKKKTVSTHVREILKKARPDLSW